VTGAEFLRQTRYEYLEPSQQSRGVPQPPLELAPAAGARLVDLPRPETFQVPPLELRAAIEARRSRRRYSPQPLTLEELSFLLWCTQGVQELLPGAAATLRPVPSAGARHALETYLWVHRVEGLMPGLYRFCAQEHLLEPIARQPRAGRKATQPATGLAAEASGESSAEAQVAACLGQGFVARSAVTFVWTAVRDRMCWRYGQRGYRYLFLDAGHACQNLYLAAEAISCGACAIAAFSDEEVNRLLGLDGEVQFALYLAAVGKRPPREET
jgi:SagB-type dehydrogenase family enzyme